MAKLNPIEKKRLRERQLLDDLMRRSNERSKMQRIFKPKPCALAVNKAIQVMSNG